MANITLDGLPAKSGTISDSGLLHLRESGVDKKVTVSAFLAKIAAQYNAVVTTFLAATSKAEMRAAMDIARKTTFSNADYTVLVTDKIVAQIGTMSAARTVTLPAASAYPAGEELVISDQSFTVTKEFKITISRAGSDTFNDGNTSIEITQKGGVVRLVSDGTSKWDILLSGNPFASSLFTGRNKIINGDFNIWQRNTSFAAVADAAFCADRWFYGKDPTGVHTITRDTDVPSLAQAGRIFNYSLKVDCTTLNASIASTSRCIVGQVIEGFNFLPIAQRIFTMSFWVKATKTGVYCISLQNSASDRTIVMEYTVNVSDTWEYKTITFPASPSAGTWNYTNGAGLQVLFVLAAGSNFQGSAGSWSSSNLIKTSNQVNALDSTSNNFFLCGVQIEEGSVATPFEQRLFQDELKICERYCEKTYDYATFPAAATTVGQVQSSSNAAAVTTGNIGIGVRYRTRKRTTPTLAIYDSAGNLGKCDRVTIGSSTNQNQAFTVNNGHETGFDGFSSGTGNNSCIQLQYLSTAEI